MGTCCLIAWISPVRDIVLIGAAAVGAIVSILGLRTWRKQLRGRTEYDLARRFLRAVYRVRDAIRGVRNPFMFEGEVRAAQRELEHGPDTEPKSVNLDNNVRRAAYDKRWQCLDETLSDLYVERLEAEVVWGTQQVDQLVDPIRYKVADLGAALEQWLRILDDSHRDRQLTHQERERLRLVVYAGDRESPDDKFAVGLRKSIGDIESFLRPYVAIAHSPPAPCFAGLRACAANMYKRARSCIDERLLK